MDKGKTNNGRKEGKYAYLIKNTGILTISSFSSRILVFLLVPLYTSILTTAEYGSYDLSVTTIQLLLPILTANIYDAVMRFFMDRDYDKKSVSAVGIKYSCISIISFGFIVLLNYHLGIIAVLRDYSVLIFFYYFVNLANQYLTQMAKGSEYVKIIAVSGVINTFVTIILNIILLLVVRMGLPGFYIAYIVGQGCSAVIIFIYTKYWRLISFRINRQYEREMLAYSLPLILGTIGWWCNNASDRYVVTFICGIAANGIYSVAYKIPSILTTIQQIFLQAWQISAVKEYRENDSPVFYGETLKVINIAMCLMCMVLIFMTKPLAHLLYAKDFFGAWQYVPFLLVSGVFNAASGILGPVLNADKDSKSLGISSLVGAVVNIILNFALIYVIGVQGAAIATAFSSFVIYAFRKKVVGEKIQISNYWKVLLTWVLIICQALVSIYVGFWPLEIVLIIMFICLNSKEVYELIKKMIQIISKRSI